MAPTILSFYAVCFIFVETIILKDVQGHFLELQKNTTHDASSWESGRLKRSPEENLPDQLKIKLKYATEAEIDLNLMMKRYQYLANEYLPVNTPFSDFKPNVMENIGEFVAYHDVEKCSALVYFKKLNALYGVIGVDYYIEGLPFNFDANGNYQLETIGEPYIRKREQPLPHIFPDVIPPAPSDEEAWNEYLRAPKKNTGQERKRPAKCGSDPSTKHARPMHNLIGEPKMRPEKHRMNAIHSRTGATLHQDFYLETLVFVTHDLAEIFQQRYGRNNFIEWIVRYHIIYFNAVDMIYKKLQLPKVGILINIAKIVIEDISNPFEFMINDDLQVNEIVRKLPDYFDSHATQYQPDSFDYVFISTGRSIYDGDFAVNAKTKYGMDLYEARKQNQFYTVVPVSVVKSHNYYADYVIAVHEIGRTLNMKIDPYDEGLTITGQCHGIMQREGAKCMSCLTWSDDSQKHFEIFFNENKNRCFLLNPPRSIRPRGISKFVPPNHQCRCFGFHSYINAACVKVKGCSQPLICNQNIVKDQYELFYRASTVKPFDGTSCSGGKVCWGGQCQSITSK